eukprot:gene2189-5403_t
MALTAAIIGAVVVLLAPAHGERIHALEAAEQVWYSRRDLSSSLSPLLNKLHDIVAEKSLLYNTSFSIGVYDANVGAFEVTAGVNNKKTGELMKVHKEFPVGSVTKPYTASAIMQLHEQKRIDIDAPIYQYVDPILTRLNKTTMLQLWNGDTTCHNITARMLMGMRGGIHDYNDTWYQEVTIDDPSYDVSPFDLLHRLNKTWVCPPGTCGEYASTGFEILGLALAEITGAHNWWDYDQFSVLPKKVKGNYNHTEFPIRGLCSKHPNIVHQYNAWWGEAKGWIPQPNESVKVNITDLDKDSCLNGWTCGNIAASPGDIARFHWDLHHGNIVSAESLKDMMHWTPMHVGWEPQLYGLAMMYETCEDFRFDIITYTVGHAGADYGSLGMMSGYNPKYKFGISLVSNSATSLNLLAIVSNGTAPRLNCSVCPLCPVLKPVAKLCLPAIKKQCGAVQHNKSECAKCYNKHRANFTAVGCSYCDGQSFCNLTAAAGGHSHCGKVPHPSPSPPISCDWQI